MVERTKQLHFLVSEDEHDGIRRLAEFYEMSLSDYCRLVLNMHLQKHGSIPKAVNDQRRKRAEMILEKAEVDVAIAKLEVKRSRASS